MSKWQSKELPIPLTILALFISSVSDKIEELTSIPSKVVLYIGLIILYRFFNNKKEDLITN